MTPLFVKTRPNFGPRCLKKSLRPAFRARLIQMISVPCLESFQISGVTNFMPRPAAIAFAFPIFVPAKGTVVSITHFPLQDVFRKSIAAAVLRSTTF